MRRSSGRGQFEPVVALVAVLALSVGLVAYADTLEETLPGERAPETARIALDRIHDRLRVGGVAVPDRLDGALAGAPEGWQVNVTLETRDGTWQRGPDAPADGLRATRTVATRVGPSELHPGKLTVVLWR
jgi:hypothetical protein